MLNNKNKTNYLLMIKSHNNKLMIKKIKVMSRKKKNSVNKQPIICFQLLIQKMVKEKNLKDLKFLIFFFIFIFLINLSKK